MAQIKKDLLKLFKLYTLSICYSYKKITTRRFYGKKEEKTFNKT
jgi:hypothetical protein